MTPLAEQMQDFGSSFAREGYVTLPNVVSKSQLAALTEEMRSEFTRAKQLPAAELFRRVQRLVLRHERARSDQTHLPPQHVEQLGKLIEARLPQESADRGETLVVRLLDAIVLALVGHCAELEDREPAATATETVLAETHRSPHPQAHRKAITSRP